MRTTLIIDDRLVVEARKVAAETGTSLSAVVEDALRESLARRKTPRARKPLRLTTFAGNGLQPGVDLDDSASVLELMERSNDPH